MRIVLTRAEAEDLMLRAAKKKYDTQIKTVVLETYSDATFVTFETGEEAPAVEPKPIDLSEIPF